MKISQNDSIALFQKFQGNSTNKIKSLNQDDRKIVMAALKHLQKNQFDETSDPKIQSLLKRLENPASNKDSESSSKLNSIFKGLQNKLNVRVSSLMINDSITAIKNKKIQLKNKFDEIHETISIVKSQIKEFKACISDLQSKQKIYNKYHNFFTAYANKLNDNKNDEAAETLSNEYLKVSEKFKSMKPTYDDYEDTNIYLNSLKQLMQHASEPNTPTYRQDLSLLIEGYRTRLRSFNTNIMEVKKPLAEKEKELSKFKKEVEEIESEHKFWKSLPTHPAAKVSFSYENAATSSAKKRSQSEEYDLL